MTVSVVEVGEAPETKPVVSAASVTVEPVTWIGIVTAVAPNEDAVMLIV